MRTVLIFIVFVCFCSLGYAQTDSLLLLAQKAKEQVQYKESLRYYLEAVRLAEKKNDKTTLIKAYSEIADIYEMGEVYEKALEYLKKIHALAPNESLAITAKKAEILSKAGKQYEPEAMKLYGQLVKSYSSNPTPENTYKKLHALRKIAVLYQRAGDYEGSLDVNLQILEIQQSLKDTEGIIIALNNVGYTYKQMRKYNQATRHFEEVLALEQKQGGKFANNPISRINLGVTYQNIGDYATALRYLQEANKMIEKEQNKREMAKMYEVYETSSLLYQAEEKYDKALDDYKKHLAIRDSILLGEHLRQQDLQQQQIVIERTEKEMKLLAAQEEVNESTIKRLEAEAERNAKEMELRKSEIEADKQRLARQESEQRANKQALEILRRQAEAEKKDRALIAMQARDALQEAELQKKSAQEKEGLATIKALEQEAKLKESKLQNKEAEAKRKEAEAKQYQYLVYSIIAIGAIIFLLVFIGLLITRRKNQQLAQQQLIIQETNAELVQTNEEIAAQRDLAEILNQQIGEKNAELLQTNEEIAAQRDHAESLSKVIGEKNESIMASIQYAQQIQQAILVAPEVITQGLSQHFILFQPRDVVSGDFYFFANTNDRLIFAAVDCTGHGVPGAFMSMIGHEILEDIIIMRQIVSPDIILNELHKGIRKALKQEQTNNRDGMDLSLVSIDLENKVLEFAGAKNPLIYIQNNEIFHLKGDKMPIGGEQREANRTFTKQSVSLDSPTVFYMFSDGFQDQFGGKDKKKFTIGRMKELFLQIHQEPIEKQKEVLQTAIQNWIKAGEEYQIDDILVIGAKV
ncbi:MAG: hypothetical protein EAZ95_10585 [Bacteroidetes bacterium]|nr:MAG: hypothetical protein EAZ95_10585 [Bacteroidota bacterium]